VWLIPLTFVGVMSVGGIVGATGMSLPGVELAISLSVVVFVALVSRCVQLRPGLSAMLVGFFAFFHGFAHGAEVPGSASLLTFGLGFVLATVLLHGAGLVTARVAVMGLACLMGSTALAQETTNAPAVKPEAKEEKPVRLPEVVVTGRADIHEAGQNLPPDTVPELAHGSEPNPVATACLFSYDGGCRAAASRDDTALAARGLIEAIAAVKRASPPAA